MKPVSERSHRNLLERCRIAETKLADAEERILSATAWGQRACENERLSWKRCEFLYGEARKRGASTTELMQP